MYIYIVTLSLSFLFSVSLSLSLSFCLALFFLLLFLSVSFLLSFSFSFSCSFSHMKSVQRICFQGSLDLALLLFPFVSLLLACHCKHILAFSLSLSLLRFSSSLAFSHVLYHATRTSTQDDDDGSSGEDVEDDEEKEPDNDAGPRNHLATKSFISLRTTQ